MVKAVEDKAAMPSIELWFYEVRNPSTGRWRKTGYRMTEQQARERFSAEVRKIEWSLEIRDGDPAANSTSSFQRNGAGSAPRPEL
jgi:hypothetical protein